MSALPFMFMMAAVPFANGRRNVRAPVDELELGQIQDRIEPNPEDGPPVGPLPAPVVPIGEISLHKVVKFTVILFGISMQQQVMLGAKAKSEKNKNLVKGSSIILILMLAYFILGTQGQFKRRAVCTLSLLALAGPAIAFFTS